ncbi:alpha/beta hydrolase [bacterium]|nr:alpha/beta hydrolase [bacterium]
MMFWASRQLPPDAHRYVQSLVRAPMPAKSIRKSRNAVEETLGGARCVWLDKENAATGVMIYLHGGAYIAGPFWMHWQWLSLVTRRLGIAGVMVDYRLADKATYPAAVDDALVAIGALREAGVLKEGRWILGGDSAGGGLAAVVCKRLHDADPSTMPAALMLTAPWVDLTVSQPGIPETAKRDPMLSVRNVTQAAGMYAAGRPLTEPDISPLYADPTGFPPTHLNVGTDDILVHEVRLYRDLLAKSGVPCEFMEIPGAIHDAPLFVNSEHAAAIIAAQLDFARRHLA